MIAEEPLRFLSEQLQNAAETSVKHESLRGFLAAGRLFTVDGEPVATDASGGISDRALEELLSNEGLLADSGEETLLFVKELPGENGVPEWHTEPLNVEEIVRLLLPGAVMDRDQTASLRRKLRNLLRGKKEKKKLPDALAALLLARMAARLAQKLNRPFKKTEEAEAWERDTLIALLSADKTAEVKKREKRLKKYLKNEKVQRYLDALAREAAGGKTMKKTAGEELKETIRQIDAQEEKKEQIWVKVPEEREDSQDGLTFWEKVAAAETERIMARLEAVLDQPEDQPFLSRVEDLMDEPDAREVRGLVSQMKEETLHALSDKVSEDPAFDLEGVLQGVAKGDIAAVRSMEQAVSEIVPEQDEIEDDAFYDDPDVPPTEELPAEPEPVVNFGGNH